MEIQWPYKYQGPASCPQTKATLGPRTGCRDFALSSLGGGQVAWCPRVHSLVPMHRALHRPRTVRSSRGLVGQQPWADITIYVRKDEGWPRAPQPASQRHDKQVCSQSLPGRLQGPPGAPERPEASCPQLQQGPGWPAVVAASDLRQVRSE